MLAVWILVLTIQFCVGFPTADYDYHSEMLRRNKRALKDTLRSLLKSGGTGLLQTLGSVLTGVAPIFQGMNPIGGFGSPFMNSPMIPSTPPMMNMPGAFMGQFGIPMGPPMPMPYPGMPMGPPMPMPYPGMPMGPPMPMPYPGMPMGPPMSMGHPGVHMGPPRPMGRPGMPPPPFF